MTIVMGIIVILTLLAVPSFLTFLNEHRLTMTGENLLYALQKAQSEAIKSNTTVYVSFQTGDSWCMGVNTGSNCTCTTPSGCNLGTISAPQAGQLTLSTTGLSSNAFTFEGSRGATNITGRVTLTVYNGTQLMSVLIGSLGDLQLCSTISGYQTCP